MSSASSRSAVQWLGCIEAAEYEQGKREPNLMVLLAYARTAMVHLEDIVADEFELPRKLPGKVHYRGITQKSSSRRR